MIEYRNVGRTGLKVSSICLGTMTFGRSANEAESAKMVSAALDRGINFFDTANSYSEGDSEVLLGKGLKGKREQAVVATKFFNPMGEGPNDSGMSRAHIMQAIEASLRERGEDALAQAMEDLRDARGNTETLRAARALRETELRESERTTKV